MFNDHTNKLCNVAKISDIRQIRILAPNSALIPLASSSFPADLITVISLSSDSRNLASPLTFVLLLSRCEGRNRQLIILKKLFAQKYGANAMHAA